MANKNCSLCNERLTEKNDTLEHIIPNAIGGRKKISGFICIDCNNKTGSSWDNELANQLNQFSLFFDIVRDRGYAQAQTFNTISGKKIKLNRDGTMINDRPICIEKINGKKGSIHINARTIEEAKKMVAGKMKKYPSINFEIQNEIGLNKNYLNEPILFKSSTVGPKYGRSLVKSALSLVVDAKVDASVCNKAIDYLLNEKAEACFGFFYSCDPIINRPSNTPLHCIYVKGDPSTNKIIGYVEFFGHDRFALCLSQNYQGKEFENSYCINPVNGKQLFLDFDFNLTDIEIKDCYDYKLIPVGSREKCIGSVINMFLKLDFEREQNRVFKEAINYAYEKCGVKDNEQITNEKALEISNIISSRVIPFLINNLNTNK